MVAEVEIEIENTKNEKKKSEHTKWCGVL